MRKTCLCVMSLYKNAMIQFSMHMRKISLFVVFLYKNAQKIYFKNALKGREDNPPYTEKSSLSSTLFAQQRAETKMLLTSKANTACDRLKWQTISNGLFQPGIVYTFSTPHSTALHTSRPIRSAPPRNSKPKTLGSIP